MRPLNLTQEDRQSTTWHVTFSVNRWEVYREKIFSSPLCYFYTKAELQEFLKLNGLRGRNVKVHDVKRWLCEAA